MTQPLMHYPSCVFKHLSIAHYEEDRNPLLTDRYFRVNVARTVGELRDTSILAYRYKIFPCDSSIADIDECTACPSQEYID